MVEDLEEGEEWGFGFRGSSPPWPYVGLGRGGLPRCGYFLGGAAAMPVPPAYPSYGSPGLCLIMEEWLIRELCHMVMLEHLWGQCREPIPMLRR